MWWAVCFYYPIVGRAQAELALVWGTQAKETLEAALRARGVHHVSRHVPSVSAAEDFHTQVKQGQV